MNATQITPRAEFRRFTRREWTDYLTLAWCFVGEMFWLHTRTAPHWFIVYGKFAKTRTESGMDAHHHHQHDELRKGKKSRSMGVCRTREKKVNDWRPGWRRDKNGPPNQTNTQQRQRELSYV